MIINASTLVYVNSTWWHIR